MLKFFPRGTFISYGENFDLRSWIYLMALIYMCLHKQKVGYFLTIEIFFRTWSRRNHAVCIQYKGRKRENKIRPWWNDPVNPFTLPTYRGSIHWSFNHPIIHTWYILKTRGRSITQVASMSIDLWIGQTYNWRILNKFIQREYQAKFHFFTCLHFSLLFIARCCIL